MVLAMKLVFDYCLLTDQQSKFCKQFRIAALVIGIRTFDTMLIFPSVPGIYSSRYIFAAVIQCHWQGCRRFNSAMRKMKSQIICCTILQHNRQQKFHFNKTFIFQQQIGAAAVSGQIVPISNYIENLLNVSGFVTTLGYVSL